MVQAAPNCRRMVFEAQTHSVCTIRADRERMRIWHSDDQGTPYGGFRTLAAALAEKGERLTFAMNAGMFHPDRRAVGLCPQGSCGTARASGSAMAWA